MTNHTPSPTGRCDVAIVGGSAAGLAAALQIQRQDRSVVVIDSGEPRNAPAAHMHGYLGYDGAPPADLVSQGRTEVRRYGGQVLSGRIAAVERVDGDFLLRTDGMTLRARRVVAATGVRDELPDVRGIERHWGTGVLHCPFCHGYEVRGRQLVQIVTHPLGLHPAALFNHLSEQFTLVVDPELDVDLVALAALETAGAVVIHATAHGIIDRDGVLTGIELATGHSLPADAVVVTTTLRPRIEPFAGLGLSTEPHPSGIADVVPTSPTGETDIEGLYAAGNLTDPSAQVLAAAADGSRVGAMVAFDLAADLAGNGDGVQHPAAGR